MKSSARFWESVRKNRLHRPFFRASAGAVRQKYRRSFPETGSFEVQELKGMLELVSLTGNIVSDDDGTYFHHTHAAFSYKQDGEHHVAAGHIKSIEVLYTAEIELRPVIEGRIRRKYDPETGTGFWDFGPETD
jgi:predicted DNA-binding protein with PD1-like motif